MEKRILGQTDLAVAPIAFGGNVFGFTVNETRSFELLDAFTGAGFNFIDTADVYARWKEGNTGGESETIIGNWLKARGNRSDVIIATKVGSDMGQGKKDISRKYILQAVEESLSRLQTDYIDLYQTHFDDGVTPVQETLQAYSELVQAGKVRWIGASNLSPERLVASLDASEAHGYPAYQVLQPEYNLYARQGYERELQRICTDRGLGVITYFSLASGFLTGKYRSAADLHKSVRGEGIKKFFDDRGFRILEALDTVSREAGASIPAVALAWLLLRPGVVAPIASATSLEQLQVFSEAVSLELQADAVKRLDDASAWR